MAGSGVCGADGISLARVQQSGTWVYGNDEFRMQNTEFRVCEIHDILPPPRPAATPPKQGGELDLIHLFTNSRDELFGKLAECVRLIKQDGTIWVSWYKKAAKLPTEITEDTVREAAFPLGLVDIKVCAVDEKWSGLKLVIRKENRI